MTFGNGDDVEDDEGVRMRHLLRMEAGAAVAALIFEVGSLDRPAVLIEDEPAG